MPDMTKAWQRRVDDDFPLGFMYRSGGLDHPDDLEDDYPDDPQEGRSYSDPWHYGLKLRILGMATPFSPLMEVPLFNPDGYARSFIHQVETYETYQDSPVKIVRVTVPGGEQFYLTDGISLAQNEIMQNQSRTLL